jgi:hypothetical protein
MILRLTHQKPILCLSLKGMHWADQHAFGVPKAWHL